MGRKSTAGLPVHALPASGMKVSKEWMSRKWFWENGWLSRELTMRGEHMKGWEPKWAGGGGWGPARLLAT